DAREASGGDVNWLNSGPVDGGDVAVVGHVRVAVSEHPRGGRVVVGDPGQFDRPSGSAQAELDSAVAGAQGADGEHQNGGLSLKPPPGREPVGVADAQPSSLPARCPPPLLLAL